MRYDLSEVLRNPYRFVAERGRERLGEEEFERKVAAARRAVSLAELRALLADLSGAP